MFDKTTVHAEVAPAYPQHIHNAPTIDSVKLLRELEAEAEKRVTQRWATGRDNVIEGVAHHRDERLGPSTVTVAFKLNGRPIVITVDARKLAWIDASDGRAAREAGNLLLREVSNAIATFLLKNYGRPIMATV